MRHRIQVTLPRMAMEAEWSSVRLGDVLRITHGWPFKSEFLTGDSCGKPIVVNIGNFRYSGGFRFQETTIRGYSGPYPPEYELMPGDILLVMTCQTAGGEILGIPGTIPDDGHIYLHNQRMGKVVITDHSRIDSRFAYWLFLSPSFNQELVRTASGSKILHTSPGRIENFKATLPPVEEQKEIACILDALDQKIELNRRMNVTLEEMAQTLFRSWFVDFDPVRAKAEGREPEGMDTETASLFPDSFEESEIGMIPTGWQVRPVGECVQAVGGGTPKTTEAEFWDGGTIHWATPKDLSSLSSPILLDTERKITGAGLKQVSSGLLPAGTVLLSSRAPIGYLAISEVPVAVNQGFIAMLCDDILPNLYVLYWARANMEAIEGRANGSTFMEISKAAFRPIPALVASPEVLRHFMECAEPLHRRIVHNLKEIATLRQLRDELLPKLISGEVRLPEDMVAEFAKGDD